MKEYLENCRLCPRKCGVNRMAGETGYCRAGEKLAVSSTCVHLGEEPVLTGTEGVGNIFLSGCNLNCVFCQNWQISQLSPKPEDFVSTQWLAEQMLKFQKMGLPSVGFVSPTHFVPQIVEAIELAQNKGFNLPLIYNSNAYDSLEVIKQLDGIFDIYLPDFKYGSNEEAEKYSSAPGYVETATDVIREMFRQVGELHIGKNSAADRGVLVRHLVLPNDLSSTRNVMKILSEKISPDISISLMAQYNPLYKAKEYPLLSRALRPVEYRKALYYLEEFDLNKGWIQRMSSPWNYVPDFDKTDPFK